MFMAVAVSIAACNKSEIVNGVHGLSAVATFDSQTKTTYADGGSNAAMKVNWADADSFKAYYNGYSEFLVFSKNMAGDIFAAVNVPEGVTINTGFTGLYGSAASIGSDGKVNVDFSKQDGTLENLSSFDVMTADSKINDGLLSFAFKHKCAIIRVPVVNVSSDKTPVTKVSLTVENSALDSSFGTSGIIETYVNSCILTFKLANEIRSGESGIVYCIVPPMSYDEGLYGGISGSDVNIAQVDITLSATKSIEAGKVYDVKSVKYEGEYSSEFD